VIEAKTKEQIEQEMLEEISSKYEKSDGFLTRSIVKAESIELAEIQQKAKEIADAINMSNRKGEDLEEGVYDRTGLKRKQATQAKVELTITGNTTIAEKDLFSTANNVVFESLESKTITGSGTILAQCTQAGLIGLVGAESITEMPVTISGVESVTNSQASYEGFEAEQDEELLERYFDFLRKPTTSGNAYHYELWANEISEVGRAKVFSLYYGENTVRVVIINRDMEPASQALIDEVQEYIDPLSNPGAGRGAAPIGAYCTIETAQALNIDISVDVDLTTGKTTEDVKPKIEEVVTSYLREIAFKQDYISYTMIGAAILNVEGVVDHQNLTINGLIASNIPLEDDETAILNSVVVI
jgi:uncharacterized phage protein gp47/JayE